MRLIGIDSCRAGWVVASSGASLGRPAVRIVPCLEEVMREAADGTALVVIDMPIGLPEGGPRACDVAARGLLGPGRKSSVFPAPCRAALAGASYTEVCALNVAACGKAVTRQVYNILGKIRAVDRLMTPARQAWVREAHPEVIFATLAAERGRSITDAKRTAVGAAERLTLLREQGVEIEPGVERARLGLACVARDDIVDALACLVTAQRIVAGRARALPTGVAPVDARGLRMEIVA